MLPAYAGMIPVASPEAFLASSAPRVCGDDPDQTDHDTDLDPVLPAYAGMIRLAPSSSRILCRAPRVCGDDPKESTMDQLLEACSPRMRG